MCFFLFIYIWTHTFKIGIFLYTCIYIYIYVDTNLDQIFICRSDSRHLPRYFCIYGVIQKLIKRITISTSAFLKYIFPYFLIHSCVIQKHNKTFHFIVFIGHKILQPIFLNSLNCSILYRLVISTDITSNNALNNALNDALKNTLLIMSLLSLFSLSTDSQASEGSALSITQRIESS